MSAQSNYRHLGRWQGDTGARRPHVISLYQARLRAKQMGARINALVVSDDGGDLASYYAKKMILGSDAFVMDIKNYANYSAALIKRLIRELASEEVDSQIQASAE